MRAEEHTSGTIIMEVRRACAGSVAALWRYPVKSMRGEELTGAPLTARGIIGDRAYAVLDIATGHIASAKHPRIWGALLACGAAFAWEPRPGAPLPPALITLPDGRRISSAQEDADLHLSHALGREVRLIAEAPPHPTREANRAPVDADRPEERIVREPMGLASPAGTLFDHAVLHLLTTATLETLGADYRRGRFAIPRFRPNIVVDAAGGDDECPERSWLGRGLVIGAEARLRVIDPTPRCVMTTLAQGDLPPDPGILRAIARREGVASVTIAPGVIFPAVAGVYADVTEEGVIGVGDPVLPV